MFLLARSWGLGPWGRWYSGLTFPFCGFLVVWLLYPVTAAAVWMPWLFLATDGVLKRPDARRVGLLGLVVGCASSSRTGTFRPSVHVLLAAGPLRWPLAMVFGGVAGERMAGRLRPGRSASGSV